MIKLFSKIYKLIIVIFLLLPMISFAQANNMTCSNNGYTIEVINGIFTKDEGLDGAKENRKAIELLFPPTYHGEKLTIDYLYNPTHGLIDLTDVAIQKTFEGVNMYDPDFLKILSDASTQVKTQKVLLVAHSQGNFYANNFYKAVTDNGDVSKKSIGVYGVATPASNVAGNGIYRTSDTDTVINRAREVLPGTFLQAHDSIEYKKSDDSGRGHGFREVYLEYRGEEIKKEIEESLNKLSSDPIRSENIPCITPPQGLSTYNKITNVVAYPVDLTLATIQITGTALGNGVVASIGLMQKAGYALGNAVVTAGTSIANTITSVGNSLLSFFNTIPLPPASSLIAGALPLVPEQTVQPPTASSTPPQEGTPEIVASAPQSTVETIAALSAQVAVSETILSSTTDTALVTATSTPQITATSTTEIVAAVPPIFQGSGSVTGVSAEDLAKQAQAAQEASLLAQNTAITTEQTATSTADITATSTADITVTPKTEIAYDPNSVVINEIAWMGTKAQANDEWIELYNRTDAPVDLSGWTLESKNKSLSIVLAKTIPAHGYFLLERTASTTTDRQEDMTYTGALNNDGPDANIYLKNGTTTIDAVDFGYWPFGENPSANSGQARKTMERVSPYATSTLYYNWKTYSESVATPFAKDANGNDIFGTPGAKNSTSGFYTPAGNVTENTTWYAKYSPYYVPVAIAVREGATLTIEYGVTVKFAKGAPYGGGMDVRGVLQAQGTLGKPIIFTSFLDDASDGIDSNQDGTATIPAPGDWMNINFYNKQESSKIRYAQIQYGGQGINYNPNGWYPTHTGAVAAYGSSPEISDSVFLSNRAVSVYVKNGAHPVLLRNIISETAVSTYQGVNPGGYGIQIADASSTADIIGNTFKGNTTAIISESASDAPLVVRDNIFQNNQKNGEFNGYANFNLENSGNSDTGRKGGFYINLLVSDGQHKTLKKDAMPYIMESGFTIAAGGVLVIEPGTVLKSRNPNIFMVRGTLNARGTEANQIVFTSIADDSDGYDSDNASAIPLPGTWQNIQFLGASSSDSVLDHATISYGGRGHNTCPWSSILCMEYPGAVVIDNASPTISHSRFISNHAPDITVNGDSSPVFTDNTFL